jgi:hypothetical protein
MSYFNKKNYVIIFMLLDLLLSWTKLIVGLINLITTRIRVVMQFNLNSYNMKIECNSP